MRKIILNLALSLDGFIEGPSGELDWLVRDESIDFADILNDILNDKDSIFYGRISYDKWGNYQPPETASSKLKEAYKSLHSKQKYVFSNTKTQDDTGAIFINDAIKETVMEIKRQPGQNIWLYGGSNLTTTMLNLGLIDVFKFAVHPVVLGSGKPLFENIHNRHKLTLEHAEGTKSGVTVLTYNVST